MTIWKLQIGSNESYNKGYEKKEEILPLWQFELARTVLNELRNCSLKIFYFMENQIIKNYTCGLSLKYAKLNATWDNKLVYKNKNNYNNNNFSNIIKLCVCERVKTLYCLLLLPWSMHFWRN